MNIVRDIGGFDVVEVTKFRKAVETHETGQGLPLELSGSLFMPAHPRPAPPGAAPPAQASGWNRSLAAENSNRS